MLLSISIKVFSERVLCLIVYRFLSTQFHNFFLEFHLSFMLNPSTGHCPENVTQKNRVYPTKTFSQRAKVRA